MRSTPSRLLLCFLVLALTACGSPPQKSLVLYVSYQPPGATSGALLVFDDLTGSNEWRQRLAGGGTPFLANGVVYVGTASRQLAAFRATDGVLLWRYHTASTPSVAAVSHGVVYVGAGGVFGGGAAPPDAVYALNAADGTLRWRSPVSGVLVATADDLLYLQTDPDHVSALRTSDGATRWQVRARAPLARVSAQGGLVYLSTTASPDQPEGAFSALHASDGSLAWSVPEGDTQPAPRLLALGQETVYLVGRLPGQAGGGYLVTALRAGDGSLRWRDQLQPSSAPLAGVEAHGVFYLGTKDGRVSARRVSDGALRWRASTPGSAPQATLDMQVDAGFVGVLKDGANFSMLDATDGSVDWYNAFVAVSFFLISGRLISMGFVSSTRLYSIVAVYQAIDGSELWHQHLGLGTLEAALG